MNIISVGQKVICVDDTFPSWVLETYQELPVKGKVYTVRHAEPGGFTLVGRYKHSTVAILLEELHNLDLGINGGRELGFDIRRFSPFEAVAESHFAEYKAAA